ncbi:MAG: CPBP family intramembrane metalloprotease [Clostridia bacterium]|nr:CPBP family intramembrane metalloprotease [Clostridia bacterium]
MAYRNIGTYQVIFTLCLAAVFWYLIFGVQMANFWLSMAVAATVLASLSVLFQGLPFTGKDLNARAIIAGLVSAAILYLLFWLGNTVSQWIFPFARGQVASIYEIRTQGQAMVIALVLLFITSPAEEIFWRGFIQKWAMEKYGDLRGWLLGSCIYAGVHLASGNFMLVMAALVAGLFWGYLYKWEGNLVSCIISHCIWTVGIFLLIPVM